MYHLVLFYGFYCVCYFPCLTFYQIKTNNPLADDKILLMPKLKACADDIFSVSNGATIV